jgi:hypothetical protein
VSHKDVIATEMQVMEDLGWQTNTTTIILFLKRYQNSLEAHEELAPRTVFVAFCALLSLELAVQDCERVASPVMVTALQARGRPPRPPLPSEVWVGSLLKKWNLTLKRYSVWFWEFKRMKRRQFVNDSRLQKGYPWHCCHSENLRALRLILEKLYAVG